MQRQPRFPRVRLLAWQLNVSWPEEASCSCRTRILRTTMITELPVKRRKHTTPGPTIHNSQFDEKKESKRPASQILGRRPPQCLLSEINCVRNTKYGPSCHSVPVTPPIGRNRPPRPRNSGSRAAVCVGPPPTRAGKTEAKKGPGAGSFGQGQISTLQRWGGRGWSPHPPRSRDGASWLVGSGVVFETGPGSMHGRVPDSGRGRFGLTGLDPGDSGSQAFFLFLNPSTS